MQHTCKVKCARTAMTAEQCIDVLGVLQEVGNGCDVGLRSSSHLSLLETAASIPDRALVLQMTSRMRSLGISEGEGIKKRMRGLALAACV